MSAHSPPPAAWPHQPAARGASAAHRGDLSALYRQQYSQQQCRPGDGRTGEERKLLAPVLVSNAAVQHLSLSRPLQCCYITCLLTADNCNILGANGQLICATMPSTTYNPCVRQEPCHQYIANALLSIALSLAELLMLPRIWPALC